MLKGITVCQNVPETVCQMWLQVLANLDIPFQKFDAFNAYNFFFDLQKTFIFVVLCFSKHKTIRL